MDTGNPDMKAQMMAEAEKAIDNLLAGAKEKERLKLGDIEHLVRQTGQRVMEQFTGCLVKEESQKSVSRTCPECGQKMRYKGKKARDLVTETGNVHVERDYYYCPTCRKGFFPPRPRVGSE